MSDVFETLFAVNVNDHTEDKKGLTYLSWAWAWAEVKKRFSDANYEIVKFESGLPYCYDQNTGYMVYTRVTIENMTHEMWLPVMDSSNSAMKAEPYTVKTRNGERIVNAATMFDVNKAIMRCLTKNLAMFGLGLYIYAGEDLPEEPDIICDACSGVIKPIQTRTGVISPAQIAERTVARYGRCLCNDCAKKAKAEDACK